MCLIIKPIFFLLLIQNLNFDVTLEEKTLDEAIPKWHKAVLEERLLKYETDKSGFVKWEDLKENI